MSDGAILIAVAGIFRRRTTNRRNAMPLVDIHLIKGVFDKHQKQAMITKVTDAMLEVEGEAMRGVTWVRIYEVSEGEWAIGGRALTVADVKALANQGKSGASTQTSRSEAFAS
jgi:4-oxalocrotonate tautomerase